MDFEKKYNEALERARQIKDGKDEWRYSDLAEITQALTDIFPQLRESEDERIRKEIIGYLNSRVSTAEETELLYFKRWIAWLEKQKENAKSADSIPADCVSSAKCEDRWHKVGDSLPDNPREVLCKDEAGNYFIGRYYTEEGWEISNYDDEDKPHHLNPPVSKWIDFPSEKQKESLHISETCKENADSFTSEDERMRKRAIAILKQQRDYWCYDGPTYKFPPATPRKDLVDAIDVALSYLEKQKESLRDFIDDFPYSDEQKEQKPNSTEDMPYVADEHFFEREPADSFKYRLAEYMTKNCKKGEGPYGYSYNISSESILQMAEEELLKRGAVQKPAKWSEDIIRKAVKEVGLTQHQIDWFKTNVFPPKPAWSDVDEKMLKCCLIAINHYEKTCNIGDHLPTKFNIDGYLASVDKVKSWLKSIRPQPKQELSKEETKDLVHILKVLDDCYAYGKHDLSKTDHDNLTSTIKSLRPGWKPSEEHLSALLAIFNDPDNLGSQTCQLALTDLYEQLKKLM